MYESAAERDLQYKYWNTSNSQCQLLNKWNSRYFSCTSAVSWATSISRSLCGGGESRTWHWEICVPWQQGGHTCDMVWSYSFQLYIASVLAYSVTDYNVEAEHTQKRESRMVFSTVWKRHWVTDNMKQKKKNQGWGREVAKKAEAIENYNINMGQNCPCSQVPSHMEAKLGSQCRHFARLVWQKLCRLRVRLLLYSSKLGRVWLVSQLDSSLQLTCNTHEKHTCKNGSQYNYY